MTATPITESESDPGVPGQSPERDTDGPARAGLPWLTLVLFLVGLGVMIAAAAYLTELGVWAARWGQIPVFFGFFVVMAIAGRWFWGGIDAAWAAVKQRRR